MFVILLLLGKRNRNLLAVGKQMTPNEMLPDV
jgi:hypothetical protein